MEFRKGILFIRLKGDLNKDTIKGIIDKDFKYVSSLSLSYSIVPILSLRISFTLPSNTIMFMIETRIDSIIPRKTTG